MAQRDTSGDLQVVVGEINFDESYTRDPNDGPMRDFWEFVIGRAEEIAADENPYFFPSDG